MAARKKKRELSEKGTKAYPARRNLHVGITVIAPS